MTVLKLRRLRVGVLSMVGLCGALPLFGAISAGCVDGHRHDHREVVVERRPVVVEPRREVIVEPHRDVIIEHR